MIDLILAATGAVVWVLFFCWLLLQLWELAVLFASAVSWTCWLAAVCRANNVKPRWIGAPVTVFRMWRNFIRNGTAEWKADGGRWTGIGEWSVWKHEPQQEEA